MQTRGDRVLNKSKYIYLIEDIIYEWPKDHFSKMQKRFWMSFMDGPDTTFQGVTGEDYDLYFEVWQEFDPQGTQYMEYK